MSTPYLDNALRAATRALQDVVAPAVDPGNPLAQEQLKLVLRFLSLVQLRSDQVAARQRAELQAAAELAHGVAPHAGGCPADLRAALAGALADAQQLLARVDADGPTLQHVANQLDALVASLVRHAPQLADADARALQRAVLAGSARVLALRRAWLAPLALDPEPATVPDLATLLRRPA